ncbi:Late embryogenesis abundant protein [Quillaja saponaria]|uniref:Late embryogenesis abundant protein n=1 Tax=Quillaja saponaria TaxID=32244 RepID=A0AAD7L0U7_QUISA|nr:Late embryogenesis abundant protein [Quillaja saponaria]
MANHNGVAHNVEDHEALIYHSSYPCPYYVQSPSTLSYANSAADIRNIHNESESVFHSPTRSDTLNIIPTTNMALISHSSRGSNNSFSFHEKKISYDETGTEINGHHINRMIIVDGDEEEEEDDDGEELFKYYFGKRRRWWRRYCSYQNSDSCLWICLQLSWRAMVSLGVALLVFYIATKPPSPKMSIKIARVPEFRLAEGVDATGVTTKILTCNCSMNLIIENKSKLFGLHIRPPIMDISFGHLPFAFSRGPKLYAERGSTSFELDVGTRNKAMYGAGRSMQDMLDSGKGLPVMVRVSLSSSFRVVSNLIKPKFYHKVQCMVVLKRTYSKKHQTQAYSSSCTITS